MDIPQSVPIASESHCSSASMLARHSELPKFNIASLASTTEPKAALKAECVLLQGFPTDKRTLFLLPDGSGSAGSYAELPKIQAGIAVYGLNSPFISCPEEFTRPMDFIAQMYYEAICRIQPQGPYLLGGWSIGGAYAYDVAWQLVATGQEVSCLVLID